MSGLHKQVVDGIKDAMRNKDRVRLATLRDAKSKFVLEQTKTGSTDELDDAEVIKILSKLQRQRLDTAEVYTSQGRQDLDTFHSGAFSAQADVLADFLPLALSEEEVKAKVEEIISRLEATGMGDMGKVMGVASGEMAGRAEGKVISQFVREILNS